MFSTLFFPLILLVIVMWRRTRLRANKYGDYLYSWLSPRIQVRGVVCAFWSLVFGVVSASPGIVCERVEISWKNVRTVRT
jgi:hypothetical protein